MRQILFYHFKEFCFIVFKFSLVVLVLVFISSYDRLISSFLFSFRLHGDFTFSFHWRKQHYTAPTMFGKHLSTTVGGGIVAIKWWPSGYGDKRGLSNRESLVYVRENLIFDTFVDFSYGEIWE